MKCINCSENISLIQALEASPFSWPEMQTIFYECCKCKTGNHLRFSNGLVEHIKIVSAPGPNWDVISEMSVPSIEIRIDPEYFHIWYESKHYDFCSRK